MADPQPTAPPARDADAVLYRPAPPPTRTTAYGPDPAQVYDVRLPTGAANDVTVVVVHGGFWRAEYDRSHAACEAQAFADAGWPVAVVEYRRTGMPGGGWPGTGDDVAAAVVAVRADADLPDRLVLVGHSAGGHLVTWAAGQPWGADLAGVVSLAGVVDLQMAFERRLGDGAVEAFLGGTPAEQPEAYAAADPALRAPLTPVVLVHGADDDVVPPEVSRSYLERMSKLSAATSPVAPVTLHEVARCEHYGLIDPEHPAFAEVLAAVSGIPS
jgi:acetyl esterase/lipase